MSKKIFRLTQADFKERGRIMFLNLKLAFMFQQNFDKHKKRLQKYSNKTN